MHRLTASVTGIFRVTDPSDGVAEGSLPALVPVRKPVNTAAEQVCPRFKGQQSAPLETPRRDLSGQKCSLGNTLRITESKQLCFPNC
jgi:hypothetical protein